MTEANLWQKVKGGTISEPRWYRHDKDEFTTNESEPEIVESRPEEDDPDSSKDHE